MNDTLLAAGFALGTASMSSAFSLIARRGQRHGTAITGVVIGLIVNIPWLVALTILTWEPAYWSSEAWFWFFLSGITGPSLGRVFMFQAIHRLGVSRAVPLLAANPLFSAGLAYIFLGERPGSYVWTGIFLVVLGCVGITYQRKSDAPWDRRAIWLPLMSVLGFSTSNIFRKIGIEVVPSALLGITLTSFFGFVALVAVLWFLPKPQRPSLKWGKAWHFYGPCGLINTLAFLSHFAALKYGDISVVSPLSSTAPLFALLYTWIFLRDMERITLPILLGTLCVVAGGAIIAVKAM
ncbi:MAG: EamA family transporter [Nitrospinae bacterium]|nr:EamA family transporter [Nitrospinota bacterium]